MLYEHVNRSARDVSVNDCIRVLVSSDYYS